MEDNREKNTSSFAKGFLLGGLIGAGLALLYAPRTGREMREEIKRRSSELKFKADVKLGEAKEIASKILEDGIRKAEELKLEADRRIQEAQQKATQILEEEKAKISALKKEAEEKIQEARVKAKEVADQSKEAIKKKKGKIKHSKNTETSTTVEET